MTIEKEFREWLSVQASHGLCMGGYTLEEEILARGAWYAAKGQKISWAVAYNLSCSDSALCRDEELDHRWVASAHSDKEFCSKCGTERTS
jgi:hypothetical protein